MIDPDDDDAPAVPLTPTPPPPSPPRERVSSNSTVRVRGANRSKVPGLATRRQVAEALDVHIGTVQKWERNGCPIAQRGVGGRATLFDVEAVRAWRASHNQASPGVMNQTLAQERARKERAQAELNEQLYRTRARELIPATEVLRAFHVLVAAVRTRLLALDATLSDRVYRVATLEGIGGVERTIREATREVLGELSRENVTRLVASADSTAAAGGGR